ncbi:hypothetical protein EDD18DRAFT_1107773 [Armillaria luteobubalina]|uniref:Uncharacterized protein n=1 Tax=Armillaria luteobubalina TaxID=153913 RepID=A0AA39Q109_9AGAR|nr:hypothetical protein EDD18DRAFT_1107773 [Armillaria luteobubalina]
MATASSAPSPVKHTPLKPAGKMNAPVAVSATSVKRTSSRKGATKASASAVEKKLEPLFLPSDSDGKGSAPPPDRHAQLGADLAALLGTQHDANMTDPEDPVLRTMQPAFMEDHLITLGVYESLPPLGHVWGQKASQMPAYYAISSDVSLLSCPAVVHTCNFAKYGVKTKYQYAQSTGGHSPLMEDDEQDRLAVGMSMEGQDVLVPGPRKQAVMLSGALTIRGLPRSNLTTAIGRRISAWAANLKDFRGFESRRRRLSSGSGPESEADHLLIIEEESLRAYESVGCPTTWTRTV